MKISYKNLRRYKEIVNILIKYGFTYIVEKLNIEGIAYKIPITTPPNEIQEMSTGEKIRRAIEELGPTYIKIGQILSTRKDLLDQDIINELSKLRDNVEVYNTDIAKDIFKRELGFNINDIFIDFDENPIGSASIGQVYEAKLKCGEEVIIKIQRPNIEETIKSDLEILKTIAIALKDLNSDIDIDLLSIVEEFQNQLLRELDYNFEAINAIKFKKMFKDTKEVYIPKIYNEYSSKRVLVMEKIKGVKLNDIETIRNLGWDTKKISDIGIRSLFKQIFEYGFFHADPHPGNIFILNEDTISYIDFGMIGIIDKKTLNYLDEITIAVVEKNIDKIIYILTEMNAINIDIDVRGLRQDLLYLIHYYYDAPIERINIGDILNEVFRFLRRYKVNIPSQLSVLAKTVITLEGTARQLNPDFTVASMSKEFMKHYYLNKVNVERILLDSKNNIEELLLDIKTIPKQMKGILRNIEKNNVKITIEEVKLTKLERRINDMATQLSLSLVLASMVVGSSLIISSPNISGNNWIMIIAGLGFLLSFIVGILLVIKILRSKYKRK